MQKIRARQRRKDHREVSRCTRTSLNSTYLQYVSEKCSGGSYTLAHELRGLQVVCSLQGARMSTSIGRFGGSGSRARSQVRVPGHDRQAAKARPGIDAGVLNHLIGETKW